MTYRDHLYLFVKQAGSNSIRYKYKGDSPAWWMWHTVPGSSTPYAPAVVAYNDKLTVFQTGLDGKVYFNSMNRDESWSGWGCLYWDASAMITNAAPAAAVFDNRVHVVAKGLAGTPNSNRISLIATPGDLGSWFPWVQIPGNGLAGGAPRMGTGPDVNTLTVTVKGQSSNTMWSQTYKKGTGWNSSWNKMTGYSTSAPSLNTYWFGIDDPHPMSPRLEDHPEPH